MESGNFIYISTQNSSNWGNVKVEIYVDGARFKHPYSSGAYVIASASGIL